MASQTLSALFQSTLPVRGATRSTFPLITQSVFQSTLPVRGATFGVPNQGRDGTISIHAPREGSDIIRGNGLIGVCSFQSTLPVRGATNDLLFPGHEQGISIHAPREGSDDTTIASAAYRAHFNPRSP